MNLLKLKEKVDQAIEHAKECGESPGEVIVSLQIDVLENYALIDTVFSHDSVELHYDADGCASGCVLTAIAAKE